MNYVIFFFFIISLINVILATVKTIVTAKSNSKLTVSFINAIAYGFYAIVVKQIATFPMTTTVIIIIVSNLIGVTISMIILEKLKKDRLWKISMTSSIGEYENIQTELKKNGISFTIFDVYTKHGQTKGFDIFSKNYSDSEIIKNILSDFNVKYHYSEVKTQL